MIWYFSSNASMLLRIALLIATDPRLPPITRSTGFSSVNPHRRSPSSHFPVNNSSRIGEPVSTAFPSGRSFTVSGKLQHTLLALGILNLFANPGVISDS